MVGKGAITMRETRILEFKETITNTFLKTVSACSNYNGGTILFGVDDNGNVKGLPDVKQACLDTASYTHLVPYNIGSVSDQECIFCCKYQQRCNHGC